MESCRAEFSDSGVAANFGLAGGIVTSTPLVEHPFQNNFTFRPDLKYVNTVPTEPNFYAPILGPVSHVDDPYFNLLKTSAFKEKEFSKPQLVNKKIQVNNERDLIKYDSICINLPRRKKSNAASNAFRERRDRNLGEINDNLNQFSENCPISRQHSAPRFRNKWTFRNRNFTDERYFRRRNRFSEDRRPSPRNRRTRVRLRGVPFWRRNGGRLHYQPSHIRCFDRNYAPSRNFSFERRYGIYSRNYFNHNYRNTRPFNHHGRPSYDYHPSDAYFRDCQRYKRRRRY